MTAHCDWCGTPDATEHTVAIRHDTPRPRPIRRPICDHCWTENEQERQRSQAT